MKKALKYLLCAVAIAYIPCVFVITAIIPDDGWWQTPYAFRLILYFFITLPLYCAFLEASMTVCKAIYKEKLERIDFALNIIGLVFSGIIVISFVLLFTSFDFSAFLLYIVLLVLLAVWIIRIVRTVRQHKRVKLPEIFRKKTLWICALAIILIVCDTTAVIVGVNEHKRTQADVDVIYEGFRAEVVAIQGDTLIVTPMDGEMEKQSADKFSIPNWFEENVYVGEVIAISYKGEIQETYPAILGDIRRMYKYNRDGTTTEIVAD